VGSTVTLGRWSSRPERCPYCCDSFFRDSSARVFSDFVATGLDGLAISFGYQFNRFNMPLQKTVPAFTVNDNGLDVSFTRLFLRWGGLEGKAATGFGCGSVPQIASAKSVFVGGGPRFAYRGHGRFEPWLHTLIGLEHFRFTQTATAYGSNNSLAFIGGGGMDIHMNVRTAFRVQADYLGTALFSRGQTNWQIGAGVVFNF
jgi:hypothetical protein